MSRKKKMTGYISNSLQSLRVGDIPGEPKSGRNIGFHLSGFLSILSTHPSSHWLVDFSAFRVGPVISSKIVKFMVMREPTQ